MSVRLRVAEKHQMVDPSVTCFDDKAPPRQPSLEEVKMDEEPADIDIQIPQRFLFGTDLKQSLASYQERRKAFKNKKSAMFLEQELKKILQLYRASEDKYDVQLVKDVMQIVERYCIHDKKLGAIKKDIVLHVCKVFFDGNVPLLSSIVEFHMKSLVQCGFFRKLLSKIEIYFFSKP